MHSCLFCGSYGLADALRNIALFGPLGFVLPRALGSTRVALVALILLAVGIEVSQLVIPGRDSNPSDVLFNTLGGVLGVGLIRSLSTWFVPGPAPRRAFVALYCAGLLLAFGGVGIASRPILPVGGVIGQWAPIRERHVPFAGLIHSVEIEGRTLPSWAVPGGREMFRDFLDSRPLTVRFSRGTQTQGPQLLARVVMPGNRELLVLGIQGDGVVVRVRSGFTQLRLYEPVTTLPGVLTGVAAGDAVELSVFRLPDRFCVETSRSASRVCRPAMTAGRWWALGVDTHGWTIPQWTAMIVFAMTLLGLPAGWWGGFRTGLVGVSGVALGVWAVTTLTPLGPAPWEAFPLLAGAGLGAVLGRLWKNLSGLGEAGTDLESAAITSPSEIR